MAIRERKLGRASHDLLAAHGFGVNTKGRVYERATGRFASFETVQGSLQSLSLDSVPAKALVTRITNKLEPKRLKVKNPERVRGMFDIIYTQDYAGNLSDAYGEAEAFSLVQRNRTFITGLLAEELQRLLPMIRDALRAYAQSIMQDTVYDSEVEVIYYNQPGKPRESNWPEYERTGNLMMAVVHGIEVVGTSIQFHIDDNLAPYWLWVERGHRVILPGGDEPGIFVVGRPFIDQIYEAINNYLMYELAPLVKSYFASIVQEVGRSVLTHHHTLGPRNIEYFPSRGYGNTQGKFGGGAPSMFNRMMGLRK